IPPIKLRDAEDEQRVNKQPVEAVACAPELPKPTPEPRGDLCEVPEQARSIKVKEIKLEVKAKGQSKVVAWRKPPEAKIGRKSLKSVSWRIREFLPEFWTTHNSGMDLEPRSRDLHDESKHAYDAAVEIYAGLSQKSEKYLFEGYEILEGKAIWSAASSFRGYEVGDQAKAKPRAPLALGTRPEPYPSCFYVSEESDEHETPLRLICLLWRALSVFLEDTLWSALSHWTLTLIQGLMLSCFCEPTLEEPLKGQEVRRVKYATLKQPLVIHKK
ncbi:hypothetical protein EDD16DRAFT_1527952, partial [Pisolithus croceorrhizus]